MIKGSLFPTTNHFIFKNNNMNQYFDYQKEISHLRSELMAVHKSYNKQLKILSEDLRDEIEYRRSVEDKYDDLVIHNQKLWENTMKMNNDKNTLISEKEEWIGRTIKFQYLFESMKKIGLKQSDDIFECFEDIDVPDVSIRIRDKYIPTAQTDNIDYVENEELESINDLINNENLQELIDEGRDEPDIIGEYTEESSISTNDLSVSESLRTEIDNSIYNFIREYYNDRILINRPISFTYQTEMYFIPEDASRTSSAINIQRIWRGYMTRKNLI